MVAYWEACLQDQSHYLHIENKRNVFFILNKTFDFVLFFVLNKFLFYQVRQLPKYKKKQ